MTNTQNEMSNLSDKEFQRLMLLGCSAEELKSVDEECSPFLKQIEEEKQGRKYG